METQSSDMVWMSDNTFSVSEKATELVNEHQAGVIMMAAAGSWMAIVGMVLAIVL